ncbi:B-cell receptor CD22-like [Chrysemys picta bellii]|uniref:B-cell receptor CD22-like n=1 Tax=Chrysemys picta bellii TaxID=8478 RepID=UPI0032B2782E
MEALLLLALSILTGAGCQDWGVTLPADPLAGWSGSCVTIPCSYTYPEGQLVRAVTWSRNNERIVQLTAAAGQGYDKAERAQFLGDLHHDCTLRLNPLALGDGGRAGFRPIQLIRLNWAPHQEGPALQLSSPPPAHFPFLPSSERSAHSPLRVGPNPGNPGRSAAQFLGAGLSASPAPRNRAPLLLKPALDGGAYSFEFQSQSESWRSPQAVRLTVSGNPRLLLQKRFTNNPAWPRAALCVAAPQLSHHRGGCTSVPIEPSPRMVAVNLS